MEAVFHTSGIDFGDKHLRIYIYMPASTHKQPLPFLLVQLLRARTAVEALPKDLN
jgi:hypothetical protein